MAPSRVKKTLLNSVTSNMAKHSKTALKMKMKMIQKSKRKSTQKKIASKNVRKSSKIEVAERTSRISKVSAIDKVFQVVTIDKGHGQPDIGEGMVMLRRLDNGKYELFNVSRAAFCDISTEEIGERIRSIPKCLEFFKSTHESMEAVSSKVEHTLRNGGKFFDLYITAILSIISITQH